MNALDRIVEHKRREVDRRRRARPLRILLKGPFARPRGFQAGLARQGLSVICEIKRRSPSHGPLRPRVDPARVSRQYEAAGAAAISVLTDHRFFGGSLADLARARSATGLPVLRKDFIVDEYQIYESLKNGCDAVLLIVRVLGGDRLAGLVALCRNLGLDCLVEAGDRREIEAAVRAGGRIVGVNNRDLETMRVDLGVSLKLRKFIPPGLTAVSESGISSREDLLKLRDAGFDACLVGSCLMRSPEPGARLREIMP